jgi:eukaryotic translation initiation factor 2C
VTPVGISNSERAAHVRLDGHYAFRGLMSDDQTSAMLNFACKLPVYNKTNLQDFGFSIFGIDTPAGRARAREFGMSVETSLLRVPARYLAPPTLRYKNDAEPQDFKEASWNLENIKFFRSSTTLKEVLVLGLHHGPPNLNTLCSKLQTELRKLGITNVDVNNLPLSGQPTDGSGITTEAWVLRYFGQLKEPISAPALVVLPKKCYDSYAHIKRVADLQLGRHAVCAVSSNAAKRGFISDQYIANVGMKFNLKGGGSNHAVPLDHLASILGPEDEGCQTIIIGADVAHPTGSARPGCPSIGAVVGSTDDHYLHYPGSMRLQVSRQEFIADLADMVKERLVDWAVKHKRRLPTKMLFYRDGVSESQYKCVRDSEITQLKEVYQMAHEYLRIPGPTPSFKLTFIVVGKRHNTRFFTDEKENTFLSSLSKEEAEGNYKALQQLEGQVFQQKLDERTG